MTDTANKPAVERAMNYARAVDMAMAGATNAQIANDLKVDVTTVSRFFNSGQGQAMLRAAMLESMDRTDRFTQTAHNIALRTLVRAMNEAERWGDKIAAARAITGLQTKRVEITGALEAVMTDDNSAVEELKARLIAIRERHTAIDVTAVEEPLEAVESDDTVIPLPTPPEPTPAIDTPVEQPVRVPARRPRVRAAI
jgi:hypothetical protein